MPTKFDFVSPGIELREIDQSAIAEVPENDGLLLIGRAKKGPAMKPIKITSLTDFQSVFGTPMDGVKRGDPWREGNSAGGGWAAYAAEAYLAAEIGPVKFIRLAGVQSEDAATDDTKKAGWSMEQSFSSTAASNKGAMGIFVAQKPTASRTAPASVTLDINSAMLANADGGGDLVVGTANSVIVTVQYLDLSDPAASFTINFYDSVNGGSNSAGNINVDIAGKTSVAGINDALYTEMNTAVGSGQSLDGLVTVTGGSGAAVEITMVENGAAGNLKTVVADEAIFGTTPATDTLTFAGGAEVATGDATLGAILYANGVSITLSGKDYSDQSQTKESGHLIKSSSGNWTATLTDGTLTETVTFNFEPSSQNFIRNVFSTDATLLKDANVTRLAEKVFLGESFEYNVQKIPGYGVNEGQVAFVAGIVDGNKTFTDHRQELAGAKTGWFIGSNASQQKRLFRFAALDEGSDFHKTHIIRIKDLRKATVVNPEATFTVQIAKVGAGPNDYEENYANVTLNPDSPNYIKKIIGDVHQYWDADKSKIVTEGAFTNRSDLVRVEVAPYGVNKTDLPLGFMGPAKIPTIELNCDAQTDSTLEWITAKNDIPSTTAGKTYLIEGAEGFGFTMNIKWPTHQLAIANSYINGTNYSPSAIMGLSYDAQRGLEDFADIGVLKADWNPHLDHTAAASQAAYVFSLENMKEDSRGLYYYESTHQGNFETLLADGVRQFAAPFFGGTDGLNIKLDNPFNEARLEADGYEKYSLQSAIYQVADYYTSRYDLISIPGVTNTTIIGELVRQTEARGDALAIVDLKGIFQSAVDNGTDEDSPGTVKSVVDQVEGGFASSYAAAYYPNVRIADVSSNNGSVLMAPPSVAAIGAIAKSESMSQPWFAPAGFNRGGLAPLGGTGGANVVGTLEHLSKSDRDNLYNVNINPIARFPATGDTVIFGQKTLQPSKTALDRINVRRMMIYLKKRIGGISDQFLFEQGVKSTYDRFKASIEPILSEVRSQYGITEYKVVLDETTTTPDLQDRNIMYAKVYVKPAKAIEYVVIDFVVTQSGVDFS